MPALADGGQDPTHSTNKIITYLDAYIFLMLFKRPVFLDIHDDL